MEREWRATEQLVRSVPEPEWTKSWHPVSHGKVLDALDLVVKDVGMEVVNKTYSLGAKRNMMFGTWTLDKIENGMRWMVGFRNSMDKSLALGVCAGNHVISCSNMQFKGDSWIEFKRHTSLLDWDELVELAKRAFVGLIEKMAQLATWHKSLKDREMNSNEFKVLTFDAMRKNVFAPQQFPKFLECVEMEEVAAPDTTDTLYHFNGSVTRLLREQSLFAISYRTTELIKMLDHFMVENPVMVN